jgi:hypothetical protein
MLMEPTVLGLITTYQCTSACDHCCFHCSPLRKKRIPPDRLTMLIEEAARIPTMKTVVFTGGECFLLGDELDSLVALAHAKGLRTRCITNGYWATSPAEASRRVKKIVACGLDEINFSTGGMHVKAVPLERVMWASRASIEAGLTTLINLEIFNESELDPEAVMSHPDIEEFVRNKKITIRKNPWIMTGGRQKITNPDDCSRFSPANECNCYICLDSIAVTPELELYACCGFSMKQIPELSLGSVRSMTIRDVIDRAPDDFMKVWLHVEGPEKILRFVKKHRPDYRLPIESTHICETCRHIYGNETVKAVIGEHYPEIRKNITERYFVELAAKSIFVLKPGGEPAGGNDGTTER